MDMITYARAKKYADKVVATGGNTELIESLVTEGVTKVVAGADADFDTLKEVADWIKNDKTGAAKMQVDIGTLKTDLKNIELTPGPQGPQGDIGPQGPKGDPSKSAYEYAQDGGYAGTEEEFASDLHEAMNPVQVDWEQANENAIDYIKNKPFGETNEFEYVPLVENLTLATNTSGMLDKLPSIEYDNSYKIVVDGKEYFCEPVSAPVLGSSTPAIGNTSPISGGEWDSTQPPLYIGCISNFWMIGTANRENGDTTPYMVSVFKKQRIIKRLNLEYIQDIAGSQCHVQDFVYGDKTYNSYDGAEIFNSKDNVAIGFYSHAEGHDTIALGDYSHAEGSHCETVGYSSHAEGSGAQAIGNYSHAEGTSTEASGDGSHAEGSATVSSSTATHAEGYNTIANTPFLHVQGSYNIPEENPTLFGWGIWNTIGNKTYDGETVIYIYDERPSLNKTTGIITAGEAREGTIKELKAENYFSFENQSNSVIEGVYCTREFIGTETNSETGITSYTWHLVMYKASPRNFDLCKYLHIVGNGDRDKRSNAHTLEANGTAWYAGDVYVGSTSGTNKDEGSKKLATEEQIVGKKTEGTVVTFEDKEYTCGTGAEIFNDLSTNLAIGEHSHAEGSGTIAQGLYAHAEGMKSQALGNFSHAENYSQAQGGYAHSEGSQTIAKGTMSHVEGWLSESSGDYSHAEGHGTVAFASRSHVQGMYNKIDTDKGRTVYVPASLGLGNNKTFNKDDVVYVLEGIELNFLTGEITAESIKETLVKDLQVDDEFALSNTNIREYYWLMSIKSSDENQLTGYCVTTTGVPSENLGKYAHIVGNGGSPHARSNAHTLDWDGNAWYAGSVECTSFILKSSTEGSNKRFRVTIDDSGELHTEEIVE